MTVDLLYTSHNRLDFVRETFAALAANTNWELVQHLHVLDDASTDGTFEHLMAEVSDLYGKTAIKIDCHSENFGGPVAAMNHAVDHCDTDVLVKVDSDLLLCPRWVDVLLDVLAQHPAIDALGFEAGFGEALGDPRKERLFTVRDARYIGGLGAYRTRIFKTRRPRMHERYFGLTEFLRRNANCAWLSPDLPCVLLDHLPFEPWRSLTEVYVSQGWSRSWPTYPESMRDYWNWWQPTPVCSVVNEEGEIGTIVDVRTNQ